MLTTHGKTELNMAFLLMVTHMTMILCGENKFDWIYYDTIWDMTLHVMILSEF